MFIKVNPENQNGEIIHEKTFWSTAEFFFGSLP